ncbi:hypothetical protein SEA_FUZZBUSTER_23 [Microbacterium phage FuzzBuster]|uniref:Uncharacterized protein n=1 Tax=Microbacterium phage FuzzBuster TaxID=2590935 RepID=A0A516KV02_9CAUD|nr:hypothetical protein SEA_FUZZBUSTER_23 [Microbacterium phage FuzzBuster]
MSTATPVRNAVVEEFDALLALGFEVGDVLLALGKSYDAARKSVIRAGREDLNAAMQAWKKRDTERLLRAKGLAWF